MRPVRSENEINFGMPCEGEVRYMWNAIQTTTPAYALTRFTFTGQYSYYG